MCAGFSIGLTFCFTFFNPLVVLYHLRKRDRLLHNVIKQPHIALILKGHTAKAEAVERHAHCPYVCLCPIKLAASTHLRREEGECALCVAQLLAWRVQFDGTAKVSHFQGAAAGDEEVVGFDVSVDDVGGVNEVEGRHQLADVAAGERVRKRGEGDVEGGEGGARGGWHFNLDAVGVGGGEWICNTQRRRRSRRD